MHSSILYIVRDSVGKAIKSVHGSNTSKEGARQRANDESSTAHFLWYLKSTHQRKGRRIHTWIRRAENDAVRVSECPRVIVTRPPHHDPSDATPVTSPLAPPQDVVVRRPQVVNAPVQHYFQLGEVER